MYYVYADDTCIHNSKSPDPLVKVLSPKLKLSDNAAGSFTFQVPPDSIGYNLIERLRTIITVKRDSVELWSGRVIEESQDFWKNRNFTCEGELAFLNDTVQPPAEYHDISPANFLETLLTIHNGKNPGKPFYRGIVTVEDPNDSLYRYTNYESTYEAIKEKLLDKLGGHLRIRKENGMRYLDYLKDYPNVNTQTIEFGKNLIDFTKNFDVTELSTVVVPLGCNISELGEESRFTSIEEYLDVSSLTGSIYVVSQEAVNTYGWIEKILRYDDVKTPEALLRKANAYLEEQQFDEMQLELSAVDMHYFNIDIEAIDLLDEIRCISTPHGMNRLFPITTIDIPLDAPENTRYTLGDKVSGSSGISAKIREESGGIKSIIETLPSTGNVLRKAKENADAIIRMHTNGYITIRTETDDYGTHSDALYISNEKDVNLSTKYWVWNVNGLAYYNLQESNLPKIALTMDGTIVADRMKTGILGDETGLNYWNMETGEIRLSYDSTRIGGKKISTEDYASSTASNAASSAVTSYDQSLGPVSVFNKLTNNGAYKGIVIDQNTGTYFFNADCIYTGILSDKLGYNYWNLDTGQFRLISSATTIDGKSIATTDYADSVSGSAETNAKSYAYDQAYNFYGQATSYADTAANRAENAAKSYADGAAEDAVDLYDSETLNQLRIFNKLTNYGQIPTIYMENGMMYINANYIATGILSDPYQNTVWNLTQGTLISKKLSVTTPVMTIEADNAGSTGYISLMHMSNGSVDRVLELSSGQIKYFTRSSSISTFRGSLQFFQNRLSLSDASSEIWGASEKHAEVYVTPNTEAGLHYIRLDYYAEIQTEYWISVSQEGILIKGPILINSNGSSYETGATGHFIDGEGNTIHVRNGLITNVPWIDG